MRHLLLVGLIGIASALSGCKSNPYCLNCGQTSGGGGGDGGFVDLAGVDLAKEIDMAGQNGDGGCAVTNNGVEICDNVDNDCNGKVDDNVDPSKLASDPNNCGKCGVACDYSALHQFGACMNGTCAPSGCTPGFVDADGNPANGCELQCTVTNGGVEICDGLDNDCNGTIDDPFTTTFTGTKPNYDKDTANCGGCGFACNLPNAATACIAGPSGVGVCHVTACNNTPGVATFKHNPALGNIDTTGCEYQCPVASSTAGDCNSIACTFAPEVCNGQDDDCNFLTDDALTDSDLVPTPAPCATKCPGGLLANCKGVCTPGTTACVNGVKECVGGTGPRPGGEICNHLDDNCDGQVDEPFTAPSPAGFQGGDVTKPLYNLDPKNCGGCNGVAGYNGVCNLNNAVSGCHSASAGAQGNCYVVSCNSGFNKPTIPMPKPANCATPPAHGPDSDPGMVTNGSGCWYACGAGNFIAPSESLCDGKDNNCNGCIDDGLTPPSGLCASQGACSGKTIPITCNGASGFQCNYAGATGGGPKIDYDPATGLLRTVETICDQQDNNCNGFCDENFPQGATLGPAQCPKNPNRAATACTAGFGLCQGTGVFACGAVNPSPSPNPPVCNATPNNAAATDETCNGVDDNCNGVVDDPNPGVNSKKGYVDAVVRVTVPAGDTSPLVSPTPQPQHIVYMYPFEAARPDSTSTSPGGNSSRSCAKNGVLPWSGATEDQARVACTAAGGRLCTAFEWSAACVGPGNLSSPVWSQSVTPQTNVSGVCNDVNRANPDAVWTTGHAGSGGNCTVAWQNPSPVPGTSTISDLSGNLFEWTSTPVLFQTVTGGSGASINNTGLPANQMRISGLSGLIANAAAGMVIQLTGSAANNGFYSILQIVNDTTAIVGRVGYTGTAASGLGWSAINTYYKLRGGSFTSPPGGTECNFDFDIAPLSFTNTDVGFRCCFDRKPCVQNSDCSGIGNGVCTGIGTASGGFCPAG